MIPLRVSAHGPPGLVFLDPVLPPTTPLRLPSLGLELPVWSDTLDVVIPFYAVGELASETRPLDRDSATIEITIRHQACDDEVCLLPKTEKLSLELPLDVIDVPALGMHKGHGQREGDYDGTPHMRRLILRKLRRHPLGLVRFLWKSFRLERAAARRRREGIRAD